MEIQGEQSQEADRRYTRRKSKRRILAVAGEPKDRVLDLSELADYYTGLKDATSLVKAYALFNFCARHDEGNSETWQGKADSVMARYWTKNGKNRSHIGDCIGCIDTHLHDSELTDGYDAVKVRAAAAQLTRTLGEIRENTKNRLAQVALLVDALTERSGNVFRAYENDPAAKKRVITETVNLCGAVRDSMLNLAQQVVAKASEFCGGESAMGNFCILAIGPIVQQISSPYSKLQLLFLVDEKAGEMCKWLERLAVLLKLLAIDMGETNLNSLSIPELAAEDLADQDIDSAPGLISDQTASGFCVDLFDGLGKNNEQAQQQRAEFPPLHTVAELVGALQQRADDSNLDFACDLSNSVCLLGDQKLHEELLEHVKSCTWSSDVLTPSIKMLITDLMSPDDKLMTELSRPNTVSTACCQSPFSILNRLKVSRRLEESDLWQIASRLEEMEILSPATANQLRISLSCSAFVRLSADLHCGSSNGIVAISSRETSDRACKDIHYIAPQLFLHMLAFLPSMAEEATSGRSTEDVDVETPELFLATEAEALLNYCCGRYRAVLDLLSNKAAHAPDRRNAAVQQMFIYSAIKCGELDEADAVLTPRLESCDRNTYDYYLLTKRLRAADAINLEQVGCHLADLLFVCEELYFTDTVLAASLANLADLLMLAYSVIDTFDDEQTTAKFLRGVLSADNCSAAVNLIESRMNSVDDKLTRVSLVRAQGDFLLFLEKSNLALDQYFHCKAVLERMSPEPRHSLIVPVYTRIGTVQRILGNCSEAEGWFKHSLSLFGDPSVSAQLDERPNLHRLLALTKLKTGNIMEANVNLFQCQQLLENRSDLEARVEQANSLWISGLVRGEQKRSDMCLLDFLKSLNILRDVFRDDSTFTELIDGKKLDVLACYDQ